MGRGSTARLTPVTAAMFLHDRGRFGRRLFAIVWIEKLSTSGRRPRRRHNSGAVSIGRFAVALRPAKRFGLAGNLRCATSPPGEPLTPPARLGHRLRMDEGEILVDARGHRCPVPTLKLRRALAAAPAGARLRLVADDPLARIDVPHFLVEIGAQLEGVSEEGGALSFRIVKRAPT
jgi:tRNA 2-thiouridine synthesizing protein A